MHAVVHGDEGGVFGVPSSLAEGGAAEGEGVCFEEDLEEAGADLGAGLEEGMVDWFGGVEGDGGWRCDGEVVDSCQDCCW